MLESSFSGEFILFPFADVITSIVVFNLPDSLNAIVLPLAFVAVTNNNNNKHKKEFKYLGDFPYVN